MARGLQTNSLTKVLLWILLIGKHRNAGISKFNWNARCIARWLIPWKCRLHRNFVTQSLGGTQAQVLGVSYKNTRRRCRCVLLACHHTAAWKLTKSVWQVFVLAAAKLPRSRNLQRKQCKVSSEWKHNSSRKSFPEWTAGVVNAEFMHPWCAFIERVQTDWSRCARLYEKYF